MFGSRQGFFGSADQITGSVKSKMAADGHLGMTAPSRVTHASAGLSCYSRLQTFDIFPNVVVSM